jgi:hypothetical protein
VGLVPGFYSVCITSRVVPPTVLVIENVIICLLENLASARNSNEGKQECLQWGRVHNNL